MNPDEALAAASAVIQDVKKPFPSVEWEGLRKDPRHKIEGSARPKCGGSGLKAGSSETETGPA